MISLLESICTLIDHRFPPLCGWIIRHDGWWRDRPSASDHHRELRSRFLEGAKNLPFPSVPPPRDAAKPEPSEVLKSRSA